MFIGKSQKLFGRFVVQGSSPLSVLATPAKRNQFKKDFVTEILEVVQSAEIVDAIPLEMNTIPNPKPRGLTITNS